jgi:2'-5' RNA ligase
LRFIGEVDRHVATDLSDGLGRVHPASFDVRIKGVGSFDHRASGAIFAAVEPKEPLAALAAKIERVSQGAGLEPERRAFHPHVTLARWSGRRTRETADFLDRLRGLASAPWTVDQFILFESHLSRHGAHYEEIAVYPLG